MKPERRHLLFVYVVYNYLKYNGLSYLRVFAQYESYTLAHSPALELSVS